MALKHGRKFDYKFSQITLPYGVRYQALDIKKFNFLRRVLAITTKEHLTRYEYNNIIFKQDLLFHHQNLFKFNFITPLLPIDRMPFYSVAVFYHSTISVVSKFDFLYRDIF